MKGFLGLRQAQPERLALDSGGPELSTAVRPELVEGWRLWLNQLRPGDWGVVLLGLGAVLFSAKTFWVANPPGAAEWAVVRQNGQVVAELALNRAKTLRVTGPLGETVIELPGDGRARVLSDPGPRQYCVRQGWLRRNGEMAICAPNQVSLQMAAREKAYDSLAY